MKFLILKLLFFLFNLSDFAFDVINDWNIVPFCVPWRHTSLLFQLPTHQLHNALVVLHLHLNLGS